MASAEGRALGASTYERRHVRIRYGSDRRRWRRAAKLRMPQNRLDYWRGGSLGANMDRRQRGLAEEAYNPGPCREGYLLSYIARRIEKSKTIHL